MTFVCTETLVLSATKKGPSSNESSIANVPAESLKHRIDERLSDMCFFDTRSRKRISVGEKVSTELRNAITAFGKIEGH